jgi:predicted DNA-binding protein
MPREVLTIRLETETRRRLSSVARRRGRTPSAIVRTAIEAWLDAEEGRPTGTSAYDVVADLVGCVKGNDRLRSTRGARAVAASLRRRRRDG